MNWLRNLWLKIKGYRERESITLLDGNGKMIKIYEGIEVKLPLGTFTLFESIDTNKYKISGSSRWEEDISELT